MSEAQLERVISDYRSAGLSEAEVALCDYAVKLTKTPSDVSDEDLNLLRKYDLSDEQLLLLVSVISYFNFINRMADGLGVDAEPEWGEPTA